MNGALSVTAVGELDASLLQAAITLGLAVLCGHLYYRYRKDYFAWLAMAWSLYVLRLGAIISFLVTAQREWLYWHQVTTGWVALALLWSSLVFSQGLRWRWSYLLAVLFPPLWSYVAIYRLEDFLLAAGPAVAFLSLATLWTGWVFYRHQKLVRSLGARVLATAYFLWGLHHLDYPFLRPRGLWNPWGYYLDIAFELLVGAGIFLLVLDDLQRGLRAMLALSGDLQRRGTEEELLDAVLRRPLTLPAVRGSAIFLAREGDWRCLRGAGTCVPWSGSVAQGPIAAAIEAALRTGRPQATEYPPTPEGASAAYGAVLPIFRGHYMIGALALLGDARDPFAALDDDFLLALGQQVGAALENASLNQKVQQRSRELERLSARMVQQHEEERRRLSRELHDETAQVFTAVKMQLGLLRRLAPEALTARLDRILGLMDTGIRSIRSVTNDLRPSLLDDLGLLPALRSLAHEFAERSGLPVDFSAPAAVPALSDEAELALFRALQEALSNVARHARATHVRVTVDAGGGEVRLAVVDDGRGLPPGTDFERLEREGHMGLTGMRERIGALGGAVTLAGLEGRGSRLDVRLPAPAGAAEPAQVPA